MTFELLRPGRVPYEEALQLQRDCWEKVRQDSSRSFLLLLEHPPVFTLGRNGDERNVLAPHDVPVVRTDRGGDVTYHGPGQLVGYPILNLRACRLGLKGYVKRVEESLVAGLSELGITAARRPGCVGVWAGEGKIASLGFRVERGITRHGFALNVNNSLEPFTWIRPCGIPDCPVTSVSRERGRETSVKEASEALSPHLESALTLGA